jgi:hypothetical protein
MAPENVAVERIEPLAPWPDCYLVTGSGNTIVVGYHKGRWSCGSTPDEVLDGTATVIAEEADDLLAASRVASVFPCSRPPLSRSAASNRVPAPGGQLPGLA